MVLRRIADDAIEVEVLTLWDSMGAIHEFAGDDAERAVVEPEARAALRGFDRRVQHFEECSMSVASPPARVGVGR